MKQRPVNNVTPEEQGWQTISSLPDRIAVSNVVALRKTLPSDATALFEMLQRNTDIPKYTAWAKDINSVEEVVPSLQRLSNEVMDGRYVITNKGGIVGAIWAFPGATSREFGVGYCLDKSARGNGYASMAITSLLEQLKLLGASQAYFQIIPSNKASAAIPLGLGGRKAEVVMGKDFPVLQQRWRLSLAEDT